MQLSFDQQIDRFAFNSYRVLGHGSFGKVVLGYDLLSRELVAVKIIDLTKIVQSIKEQQLVQREIDILNRIKHPNIVNLIQVILSHQSLYLIIEYCPEGDLYTLLQKSGGILPLETAFRYFCDIVNAFQVLYHEKIIHRDIKPANLLLKNGRAMISDFGFARFLNAAPSMEDKARMTILGSPLYMSPQLLREDKFFSSKCDVWSLGVVLYQMVFGVLPWTGDSQIEIYQNIMTKDLQFPPEPLVLEELKDLIKRMLGKEEQDRISWPEIFEFPLVKKFLQQQQVQYEALMANQQYAQLPPQSDYVKHQYQQQQQQQHYAQQQSTLHGNPEAQMSQYAYNGQQSQAPVYRDRDDLSRKNAYESLLQSNASAATSAYNAVNQITDAGGHQEHPEQHTSAHFSAGDAQNGANGNLNGLTRDDIWQEDEMHDEI